MLDLTKPLQFRTGTPVHFIGLLKDGSLCVQHPIGFPTTRDADGRCCDDGITEHDVINVPPPVIKVKGFVGLFKAGDNLSTTSPGLINSSGNHQPLPYQAGHVYLSREQIPNRGKDKPLAIVEVEFTVPA